MTKPKICVSVSARQIDDAEKAIRDVESYEPDLIEIRIDHLETQGGLERLRESTNLPLIATNRRRDQGGLFVASEDERISTLLKASKLGFDYVDLELTTPSLSDIVNQFRRHEARLIISSHDLRRTPSKRTLKQVLRKELGFEPDICKIVGTARSYPDNLTYLNFLKENHTVSLICFGMSQHGIISRVLSPLFGGAFTYASVEHSLETAPGQLTIRSLKDIYDVLRI